MISLGDEKSGAIFSDDMRYRYRLWRCWNSRLPRACFCLMNPSTADEIDNDPTIERQYRRVLRWSESLRGGMFYTSVIDGVHIPTQFGSIEIVNAFAYRSTDNAALYGLADPVGPGNDAAILNATTAAIGSKGIVVCGWGKPGAELPRPVSRHAFLRDFFKRHNIPVSAFKLNADGTPQHPLYLGYALKPREWNFGATLGAEVV